MRTSSYFKAVTEMVGYREGVALVAAKILDNVSHTLFPGGHFTIQAPTLGDIVASSPSASDVDEVLAWLGISKNDQMRFSQEFDGEVLKGLANAYDSVQVDSPLRWAIENKTAKLLYTIVRSRRPEHVVETGVANGHSSFVLLTALERNDFGQLTSFDVRPSVGELVGDELRDRWTLITSIETHPTPWELKSYLPDSGIDIFFHDGDHSFLGQMIDYTLAASTVKGDGIVISDDIDSSRAWLRASQESVLSSDRIVLVDSRKLIGFARKSLTRNY